MRQTVEVWSYNLVSEFGHIYELACSPDSSYVCIDMEFPGFIHRTPMAASPQQRYVDMKRNVEAMKLIQLGFTFYGRAAQSTGSSWQVNFREFDPCVDVYAENSIQLLMNCGIDFEKNKQDGVDESLFGRLFWQKLIHPCRNKVRWILFHGLYDLGYIARLLIGSSLPDTLPEFLMLASGLLGDVYDLKYIARFYGFDETLGLTRIAEKLGVNLEGHHHHQAGHDSMLIGDVFWRMKELYHVCEDQYVWIIHGAELLRPALPMRMIHGPQMRSHQQPYHRRGVPMAVTGFLPPWGYSALPRAPIGFFVPWGYSASPSFNYRWRPYEYLYPPPSPGWYSW